MGMSRLRMLGVVVMVTMVIGCDGWCERAVEPCESDDDCCYDETCQVVSNSEDRHPTSMSTLM